MLMYMCGTSCRYLEFLYRYDDNVTLPAGAPYTYTHEGLEAMLQDDKFWPRDDDDDNQ